MAKLLTSLLAVIALGVACAPAWAVEVGVDARLAFYRWEENVQPIAPLETGPMALVGPWVSAPLPSNPAVRLNAALRFLIGYVNYDTALLNAPSVPVNTETAYFGSTQEASVGWRVQEPHGFLEPFAGLGFRWWLRSIQSNSTATGYDEWYRILVLRVGMRGQLAISDGATLYGEFSGDPMLWAREDVHFPSGEEFHVENGKRLGWTIETGVRTKSVDVGVFWQAMRLGQSNILSNGLGQPESDQDIIGLRFAVPIVLP